MQNESPNGVRRYAHAMVDLYFPNGKVCCDLCPLLETYSRKQCRQTGEYIIDSKLTGLWCPLKVDDEIKEMEIEENETV